MSKTIPLIVGGRVGSYILKEEPMVDGWSMLLGVAVGMLMVLAALYIFGRRQKAVKDDLRLVTDDRDRLEREAMYQHGRNDEAMARQLERDRLNSRVYELEIQCDKLRRQLNDESIFANSIAVNGRVTAIRKKEEAI